MNAASILQNANGQSNQIRSVSSVEFPVAGDNPFPGLVKSSVKWLTKINPAVPRNAVDGSEFEVGGGGDHPARAVAIEFDGGRIWSSTVDNPDRDVLGRTWVTEITIAERLGAVSFGARLLNVTRKTDDPFIPSIPRVVRNVITNNICTSAGVRLFASPTLVANENDLEWLITLVRNPSRKLPVIVVAEAATRDPLLNIYELATRTSGAAHVVGLNRSYQSAFRDAVGREFAVFDGATRLFWKGFDADNSDPFSQPLWVPSAERAGMWATASLVYRVLSASVSKGTTDYPRFQAVRQAVAEARLAEARISSSDAELAKLYEDENIALRAQLQTLRDEQNQWLTDAEQDTAKAEREISELKSDLYRYKMQNEHLRLSIEQSGTAIQREDLVDLEDFSDWAAANLSNRIWIAPKAVKEIEKHAVYRSPQEIGQALFLLDDLYAALKIKSDDGKHKEMNEKLEAAGLQISACFSQPGDLKRFPEYAVSYRSEKLWCDMHLKRGGGTDPRSMFRIYFTWHEPSKVLVIGHLPTHLDNNMTN